MKSKIIYSHLDKKSGESSVIIQNKYGKFYGYSQCAPEDMSRYSQFAGERYATLRAYKSFAKLRLKQEKIKLKTIENLMKDIEHDTYDESTFFNDTSIPMRKIRLKFRDYRQSVEDWKNIYNFYEQEIKRQDEERQALLTKIKAKKN